MAIAPISTGVKKKEGGAGIGGVVGAIAGAIAAPFTGGASLLPAILGGAATGAGLGQTIGAAAAPAEAKETGGAIARRVERMNGPDPMESSAVLKDSLAALESPDIPMGIRQQAAPILQEAYRRAGRPGGTFS